MNAASRKTPDDVRKLLRAGESLLRGGDPYGATARATEAADAAVNMDTPDGTTVRREVSLALGRFEAAQSAATEEVRARQALHVANERRAAGITSTSEPRSLARASRIADLIGRVLARWIGPSQHQPAG